MAPLLPPPGQLIRLPADLLAFAPPAWPTWDVWFRYFLALVFTVAGLVVARKEESRAGVLDRLIALGPVFFAMPMAVFAGDHFVEAQAISRIVPSWMPGHLFWTYFVGAALLCAALSIVANRYAGLAGFLLGVMFLLFEALLHIPAIIRFPHERIAWNIALRDLSFAGGAFALAATHSRQERAQGAHRLLWAARLFIALPVLVFGIESFKYSLFVPGITLNRLTPTWMPLRPAWNYLTGTVEVITGLCLLINQKAHTAAVWLGVTILLLVIFYYGPLMIASFSSIDDGLNYVADTLVLSGAAFIFVRSQERQGGESQ